MKINSLLVLVMFSVLFSGSIIPVMGQSSILDNLVVNIVIAPNHVDTQNSELPIGYVNLVNKKGIAIKAPQDIVVGLESDDPNIASVPPSVIILKDHNYAKFNVNVGNIDGDTKISSLFNGKIDYSEFKVGGTDRSIPDDIKLVVNLPTNDMHVNSEMPFSVFFESDDKVIRAPFDIVVDLDFEESLIKTDSEKLVIKKGEYYSWSKLKTFENVGNAFLRASSEHFDIDVAENIEITSSLPSSVEITIFPKLVGALPERNFEVFVSLVDSEGNPAVTPEEVHIKLFSDDEFVGRELDETMEEKKVVIKKGEFGYHFREKVNLQGYDDEIITIGASIENLGIALGEFKVVEPLNIDHPKAENSTLNVFVLDKVPSNTTSLLVYQISAKGTDIELTECLELDIECVKSNKAIDKFKHQIDDFDEDELYPIQVNDNYVAHGSFETINVVSSDNSIIKILDSGSIESTQSYGTAILKSGQKIGEVDLATTVKGIGAGVNMTKVEDVFKHTDTKIFSPTGSNIVLDKNGYFDLFLLALDGKQRPKILEQNTKYILTPVNEVLEIKEDNSFAYSNFHSDSFSAGVDESVVVTAVPVGVDAELNLEKSITFDTQVSSIVEIKLPFESLDAESTEPYDVIVQLTDLLGNPSKATKDLRINLDLDGEEIINMPENVIIDEGSSYATFPIRPNGENGDSTLSAHVKGVIGSETKISTASNLLGLKIFANGLVTPLEVNQPMQLQIYIDDENAESVPGAIVNFVIDPEMASITPKDTRTNSDGGIIADLTVFQGPNLSVQVIATAEGYQESQTTFDYAVNASPGSSLALGLPDWVIYVGLAAVLGIVAVVVMFLKKPPKETYDEDEEYEYEDEI